MSTDGVNLTIRIIRSFPHRNLKHLVLHNVDLSLTGQQLIERIHKELSTAPGIPPPFKKYTYDTLKIHHIAHGAKTSNPVMNLTDDDKLIIPPETTLSDKGVGNETELSLFKFSDYEAYKKDPSTTW